MAISTPVDTVWADPSIFVAGSNGESRLSSLLGMSEQTLQNLVGKRKGKEFVYLKRHVTPKVAQQVRALDLPGVFLKREYRRYYPAGEVVSHVLGFTDIDDSGQEGVELAFEDWLKGEPGKKRVIKDRLGRIIENVEGIKRPSPGKDLILSIDRRLQYLAYRELKAAVIKHKAKSGSVVLLDSQTGEILAMVNQPSYNPNDRRQIKATNYRNRAVTDLLEPGSTLKPFTVATALETKEYRPDSRIDTAPGYYKIGRYMISDVRNYGLIDVARVIQKSSNVGVSKIALSLDSDTIWQVFSDLGFGSPTSSGFPGEAFGRLSHFSEWRDIEKATLAFGYGLAVTPLQLAQAYSVLARGGNYREVSLLKIEQLPESRRVFGAETTNHLVKMLESVITAEGTGKRAAVSGFRVAGKTGTVLKSENGGYSEDKYLSLFAGFAPATNPRLVAVVVIDEPSAGEYYGGKVAAPVFSRLMNGAMRLLDIAPDMLPPASDLVALNGGVVHD